VGEAGEADPNAVGPSSGYILLDSDVGRTYHVIAHEFFHLIQFGIYATSDITDAWLYEAAAEWMGYRTDSYGTSGQPIRVGQNDFPLDCRDPNLTPNWILCSRDSYYGNGYSRWTFFQFLADKYGNAFAKDIFAQLAINGPGTSLASLTAALGAKGATLADTYNAWATAELTGAYSVKALQGLKAHGICLGVHRHRRQGLDRDEGPGEPSCNSIRAVHPWRQRHLAHLLQRDAQRVGRITRGNAVEAGVLLGCQRPARPCSSR